MRTRQNLPTHKDRSSISWNKFYSIVSECKEFLSFRLKQLLTISVNPKLVNKKNKLKVNKNMIE